MKQFQLFSSLVSGGSLSVQGTWELIVGFISLHSTSRFPQNVTRLCGLDPEILPARSQMPLGWESRAGRIKAFLTPYYVPSSGLGALTKDE